MEIEYLKSLSDKELVSLLLANNTKVWEYVCAEIIGPMTKISKYTELFFRYSIPLESIVSQVYLDLTEDDFARLRKFRFEGPFQAWLFFQIKDSVKKIFRLTTGKVPLCLSEINLENSHIEQMDKCHDQFDTILSHEEANFYIAQLWKDNPMKAYVLLLRLQSGLSSKEVGTILGQTPNNIDQLTKRAKRQMRQLREEHYEK